MIKKKNIIGICDSANESINSVNLVVFKFFTVVFTSLFFLFSCTPKKSNPSDSKNIIKKNNSYVDLEGNPVSLSDYEGKKIILNFWATSCKPCLDEMPSLLRAYTILKRENYMVILASDENIEKIKTFKNNHNFNFNFVKFTGSFASLKIYSLPKTFIYNSNGEKVDDISGAIEWDSQKIINKLKSVE